MEQFAHVSIRKQPVDEPLTYHKDRSGSHAYSVIPIAISTRDKIVV